LVILYLLGLYPRACAMTIFICEENMLSDSVHFQLQTEKSGEFYTPQHF